MGASDVVAGNMAMLYLAVIVALKAYGLISRQELGVFYVLVVSSGAVGLILAACLVYDVARKASRMATRVQEVLPRKCRCRGGICWHGVAVRSPASQVRFRLPQNL